MKKIKNLEKGTLLKTNIPLVDIKAKTIFLQNETENNKMYLMFLGSAKKPIRLNGKEYYTSFFLAGNKKHEFYDDDIVFFLKCGQIQIWEL